MKKALSLSFLLLLVFACNKQKKYKVITSQPRSIKATKAILVGQSNGSLSKINERGFCYLENAIPVFSDNTCLTKELSNDNFEFELTQLKANTNYNFRAFSKLNDGTIIYGSVLQFQTTNVYEIGDIGPGGGIIFYIDETNSSGKYFEALLSQCITFPFGCANTITGLTSLKGFGQQNTTVLSSLCGSSSAGYYCDKFVEKGLIDWCLPTIEDLVLLGNYFMSNNIENYNSYWSSSEFDAYEGYAFDFSTLEPIDVDKSQGLKLIPIRYFN